MNIPFSIRSNYSAIYKKYDQKLYILKKLVTREYLFAISEVKKLLIMQKLNIMYIIYENKMAIYIKNKLTSYIQYLELEFHGKSQSRQRQ